MLLAQRGAKSYIDSALIWFSSVSFILFGGGCFLSRYLQGEYERYGIGQLKGLIGILQMLGAAGLVVGFYMPWIGQFSAGGLAAMMLCGVGVRIKIKDTILQTIPAFAYMVLNAYLAIAAY
ncbi:MAG: DoxX family protein [Akkermansiaceae bacterium]|nr:DoxX family protein [Akkermansiaceae bacterium]